MKLGANRKNITLLVLMLVLAGVLYVQLTTYYRDKFQQDFPMFHPTGTVGTNKAVPFPYKKKRMTMFPGSTRA